jgi:hypothetical protein
MLMAVYHKNIQSSAAFPAGKKYYQKRLTIKAYSPIIVSE